MAQLIVRQIEDGLVRKLRERAASAGVSMEEEHRRILRAVLLGRSVTADLKEHLLAMPEGRSDRLLRRKRATGHRRTGF